MVDAFVLIAVAAGSVAVLSVLIYLAIRYFAYKRSFPLPHQFDFLWIVTTFLVLFLVCFNQPPLEGTLGQSSLTWTTFFTLLLFFYLMIFVVEQFFVQYFLSSVLKIYISPPLRKAIVLVAFVLAVVISVQKIFSINPWAVYAPTSLLSLGLGIALKDVFQTFFAGVALSKVVHIGDWIQIGEKEGEVVDINWARTILRSWHGDYLFFPNRELQMGSFSNYSYRERRHKCHLEIGASYGAEPRHVKKALLECIENVTGTLAHPPAEVILLSYGDFAIHYSLNFWVSDYANWRSITGDVATRVWYAFKRENIEIPFPIRTVHHVRKTKSEEIAETFGLLLKQIDLFKMLSEEERDFISERLKKEIFLAGEFVVRQGEPGSSFYLVLTGELEALRRSGEGKEVVVGQLGSGQFFGELSLLTGEPRAASVRVLKDAEILRLEKKDFQEILTKHPSLTESLAEVVASRKSSLSGVQETPGRRPETSPEKSALSRKIRSFFNLRD
ncbi:MAG: mechanosensitive ion channel [Elusimicrobia bacterium]|nr:mechanosensitive ion channel [Elusimicrobiota bacterium]